MPPLLTNADRFNLTFAGTAFFPDAASIVRMKWKGREGEPTTQSVPEKHQPEPDLIDELNRIIPFQFLQDFEGGSAFPGRNLSAIAKRHQDNPYPNPDVKIGTWYYPTTASRWSVFRGLATSSQVKAMLLATAGIVPQQFIMKSVPFNLAQTASIYTIETSMFMLPPRPLAEHGGKFDGLYLVTLVDVRYWWQFASVSLMRAGSSPVDTWESLIGDIEDVLNITISHTTIDPVYGLPELDSQLWTNVESLPAMLDAVAYNIGRVVVRKLDGTFELLPNPTSANIANANRNVLGGGQSLNTVVLPLRTAGGDMFYSGGIPPALPGLPSLGLPVGSLSRARNASIPASVQLTFPKYVMGDDPVPHFVNPRYTNQRPSTWYEDSYGSVFYLVIPIQSGGLAVSGLIGTAGDNPNLFLPPDLPNQSGYSETFHSTAKALYSGENHAAAGTNPLNYSGLMALSLQLAKDYYDSQVSIALDEVYPGTFAWEPEGIHDIVWTYSARERLATTRVLHSPWNQSISDVQHSTPRMGFQVSGNLVSGQAVTFGTNVFITDRFYFSGTWISGVTNVPRGVGGQSVAQSVTDSFVNAPNPPLVTPAINTQLKADLLSGQNTTRFLLTDYFPTQNRWRGQVDNETILFEAVSGGPGDPLAVDIVWRGIDGTYEESHFSGSPVTQLTPNVTHGVNVERFEKAQFTYPHEWTSGGVQAANIVPQMQSVFSFSASGLLINRIWHYSGAVKLYNTTKMGISGDVIGHTYLSPWETKELIWIVEKNGYPVRSGQVYEGQMVGYSAWWQSGNTGGALLTISGWLVSGDPAHVPPILGTPWSGVLLESGVVVPIYTINWFPPEEQICRVLRGTYVSGAQMAYIQTYHTASGIASGVWADSEKVLIIDANRRPGQA